MLPRCCCFSEKLMILSVLLLVAAARVSRSVAGLEPALLWLSQSQLSFSLGYWPGPELRVLVSQDSHLWENLSEGSSQQLIRSFEISGSEGPKTHPMAMTWRSRLFFPWVVCLMPCSAAGASRNLISLTRRQPIP